MSAAVYVYRLYDAEGDLLYIGSSKHPLQRLKQHLFEHTWWADRVAQGRCVVFPNRAAAFVAEKRAIRTEHPIHNVQNYGAIRTDWTAEHYVQRATALLQVPWTVARRGRALAVMAAEYRLRFGRDLGTDVGVVMSGPRNQYPTEARRRRMVSAA